MALAQCICPTFFEAHFKDPVASSEIFFKRLLGSTDQIIFDSKEFLLSAYLDFVKDDVAAFQCFKVWKAMLDSKPQGKVLISYPDAFKSREQYVVSTLLSAVTCGDKAIVTADNNHYKELLDVILSNKVNLLNRHSFSDMDLPLTYQKIRGFSKFESDLSWVLQRVGRACRKSFDEDANNDYLRDLLSAKNYDIKDQTRAGLSMSGQGPGELDIMVESSGTIFTIIEAMKLNSLRESYINEHYKKLIHNYNPLSVKRTYLVTYYTGKNFTQWWAKYKAYISDIDPQIISAQQKVENIDIEEKDTDLLSLKQMYHHIQIEGNNALCVHYAIRIDA